MVIAARALGRSRIYYVGTAQMTREGTMAIEPVFGIISDVQSAAAATPLPGIRPVGQADWITVDPCYTGQIATKAQLMANQPDAVLAQLS